MNNHNKELTENNQKLLKQNTQLHAQLAFSKKEHESDVEKLTMAAYMITDKYEQAKTEIAEYLSKHDLDTTHYLNILGLFPNKVG